MLKDKHDIDDNEDVDLTGMINEYGQDNELRRKINELKKQKEGNSSSIHDGGHVDSAFMGKSFQTSQKKESAFPNIQADNELEKTRVDFHDESDKTLVIMGQKNKSTAYEGDQELFAEEEEVFDEDKTNVFSNEQFANFDEDSKEEDIRATIRKKKQKKEEEDPEDSAKMNKIITYVIIGIVAVCILVGGFFGVKHLMSPSPDEDDTEEVDKKPTSNKKPTTNKKPAVTDPKENINDNTAKKAQLNKQRDEYQTQLDKVITDIEAETRKKTTAQEKIDYIDIDLKNNATRAQQTATEVLNGSSLDVLKKAFEVAAAEAASDPSNEEKKQASENAKRIYTTAADAIRLADEANKAYNTEAAHRGEYVIQKDEAQSALDKLGDNKISLEKKIADITTELNNYR